MSLHLCFGGTFDPVHRAHIDLAITARDHFNEAVHLIPSADPPHRSKTQATASQRAHMLELAIEGIDGLDIDRRELARNGASYSIDTLRSIRSEFGAEQSIAWLIGADAFSNLHLWHQWRDLFDLAHWVVAPRPGSNLANLPDDLLTACNGRWTASAAVLKSQPAGKIYQLPFALHDESATALRYLLSTGQTTGSALPPVVADYIEKQQLYRPN